MSSIVFQPKNILVTGGAGFIGAHFIHYVLKKYSDSNIVNLDNLTYAGSLTRLKNLSDPNRHTFIKGNICDRLLIEKILEENKIDTIVHFAAESHVDRSISGPAIFIETNVMGTFTLLEAAKKYWIEENKLSASQYRFHHISTDEVYGSLREDESPFTESTPYAPNSPYSASKAASDHLVRAYHETYKLSVTISNCSNNFGPGQADEKFIPTIISACRALKEIPIYGKGLNIRDWIYVADHCKMIDWIIHSGKIGDTYNIGGNNEIRNIELAKMICGIFDKLKPESKPHETLIAYVVDRPGHDWRYAISNIKIESCSGMSVSNRLEFIENLTNTVKSYLLF